MTTKGSDIKGCPFCGGGATIAEGDGCYWVECWNHACCLSRTEDFPSREEAIAAWNTRAPLSAPLAEPGELEEIRKRAVEALAHAHRQYHECDRRLPSDVILLLSLLDAKTREAAEFREADHEVGRAYTRIRSLLAGAGHNAFATKVGGPDRFNVTERCLIALIKERDTLASQPRPAEEARP